jgi:acetyltransferase-like isoleucine patch superfamily enzyme
VTISDNVWVGLSALVLKGSTVGKDSVVGAGSVVRGQVPPGVVVAGDPPQILKRFKADT